MELSSLEATWQKQSVIGGEPAAALAARMKDELAIARRRLRGGIALAVLILGTGWALAIVAHTTGIKPLTPVSIIAQTVVTLLVLLFLYQAGQSAKSVRGEIKQLGGTLRDSVAATLRTVDLQINNARIALYAIPAVVAVFAGLDLAKYLAGTLPGIGAVLEVSLTAALAAAIGAAFWHRYRTYLVPRRTELRALLQTFDGEAGLA